MARLRAVEGAEAWALLERADFRAAWTALVRPEEKLSVVQEPPFVTTWYRQYCERYEPLLYLASDPAGSLAALMPLARRLGTDEILHAGDLQAEYHGWLCRPELEQSFPLECLIEIKQRLRPSRWAWRCLPPGSAIEWLSSPRLAEAGIHVEIVQQQAPLYQLRDEAKLQKLLKNKAIKSKLNRLRDRGELVLERVRDQERARALLPIVAQQCDLRQEAINGQRPFADDANKLGFYASRMADPSATHFTVLWCGSQALAFHIGACDRRQVILGLTAYDPREGHSSPGTLLLIKLIAMLKEEHFEVFDLSPGGDPYKERFANASQLVTEPTFHFSKRSFVGAELHKQSRRLAKQVLHQLHVDELRIRRVREMADQLARAAARKDIGELVRSTSRLLRTREHFLLYRYDHRAAATPVPPPADVRVQHYEDLLQLPGGSLPLPRQKLYAAALAGFDRGARLYTVLQGGELAQLGWLLVNEESLSLPALPRVLPPGSALLHELCAFRPAAEGPLRRCLQRMLADSATQAHAETFLLLREGQREVQAVAESLGFKLEASRVQQHRLWWRSGQP